MKNLVATEQYNDFLSASQRAKELAVQFKESTSIQRTENTWAIMVSESVAAVLSPPIEEDIPDFDYEEHSISSDPYYDDEYQQEVVQSLLEEIQSDQDSWARSEEEGWFYED